MKQFYFIIASSFIMGVVAGVYIYFASRVDPIFEFEGTTSSEIEITADSYGGCMRGGSCASYHIDTEGKYTFLTPVRGGEDVRQEGELPQGEFTALRKRLRDTPLQDIEESTFTGTCPITFDGLAYTFTIRMGEDEYVLNSCEQNLEGEALFEQLVDYFEVFGRV